MSNLISRSALLEEFKKCHISFNGTPMEKSDMMISYRSLARVINKQQTVEAKPVEEIYKMSESDFITYTLSTICDYAKINDYDITDTVKVMGENLVALTDICTFDNWKAGADMRGGKHD